MKEPHLVGKEEVTNCLIFRILHDGCDDLQHGSDSCMDGRSYVCSIKLEKRLLRFKIKDFVWDQFTSIIYAKRGYTDSIIAPFMDLTSPVPPAIMPRCLAVFVSAGDFLSS